MTGDPFGHANDLADLDPTPLGLVKDTQLNAPGGSIQARRTDAPIFGAPNSQQGVTTSYSRDRLRARGTRAAVVS